MKKLLALTLLAACACAHAVTFESRNKAGGAIVLTLVVGSCDADTQRAGYALTPDGRAVFGCWSLLDDRIFMTYADGDVRVYELRNFAKRGDDAPKKALPASRSDKM